MRRIALIRHGKMSESEKREMVAKMTLGRIIKAKLKANAKKHDA